MIGVVELAAPGVLLWVLVLPYKKALAGSTSHLEFALSIVLLWPFLAAMGLWLLFGKYIDAWRSFNAEFRYQWAERRRNRQREMP